MHPNETAIHDYVDDTLGAGERAEIAQHIERCAECRQLVDDLREIRNAAAGLRDDVREAPVRAWTRLERAIAMEERSTQNTQSAFSLRAPRALRSISFLAAAAAVVLATAIGLQWRSGRQTAPAATSESAPATGGSIATAPQGAETVEAELRAAEEHYANAISGLEQITKTEQSALDPGTAATLQKNLAVIDQAIGESRAALRAQPASEPAQTSLVENFKAKIGLLQDTVALINEMRKGDEAGAARIVSGLKQKGT
jgi:Putative zinc-finger